jgi:hypothetical protein
MRIVLEEGMEVLQIKITYEWQPVLLREKVDYLFPMAITPFMRTKYKEPAIFKWDVYQKNPGDKKLVYIGDAQELCPKRLYGYLNPGPTQKTNQKINTEFRGYLKEKLSIGLHMCNIREIVYKDSVLGKEALDEKYMRLMIVNAMTLEHKNKGFTVIET